jgi:hypothetical protein
MLTVRKREPYSSTPGAILHQCARNAWKAAGALQSIPPARLSLHAPNVASQSPQQKRYDHFTTLATVILKVAATGRQLWPAPTGKIKGICSPHRMPASSVVVRWRNEQELTEARASRILETQGEPTRTAILQPIAWLQCTSQVCNGRVGSRRGSGFE